jgi:hypothetical protein
VTSKNDNVLTIRLWLAKPRNLPNPYTCRLLRRIEFAALWLARRQPYWSKAGHLCVGNAEFRTVFPGWLYRLAADVQNRCPSLRFLLSV